MKKTYIAPETDIYAVNAVKVLAGSIKVRLASMMEEPLKKNSNLVPVIITTAVPFGTIFGRALQK